MNIVKYIKAMACMAVLLCVQYSVAQNIIRPKISLPNNLWANSYNGVLFFERTDMATRNTAMPMSLQFYYNSSSSETNYGYGNGFSLGIEYYYLVDSDKNVTIVTGDGQSQYFTRYGDEYGSPAGVFSTLSEYEENKYVLKEKTGECYYFDDMGHRMLTSMVDRCGNVTSLTYVDTLLVKIEDEVGHTVNLFYTDRMLTKATASFYNGEMLYSYDAKGRLVKCTDALGNTCLYSYTNDDKIEVITDANGHKTKIAYNSAGMVSRVKTAVSDKSIRYDGEKTVFVDYTSPKNEYSYYRWDHGGRAIEKVGLCCGIQATLEYDTHNNVVKRTDANGNATDYTYDENGNILSSTDALGNSEYYIYDDKDQIQSYKDKNGNIYSFAYDGKGNLISLDASLGFRNSFSYNEKGWVTAVVDANGNVTTTEYNEDGTPATETDAAGNVTKYEYDSYGNMTSVEDARGFVTLHSYDRLGRLIAVTDPLGKTTKISYDKVGNVVRLVNAKNQITAFSYDAEGNMLTRTEPSGGKYIYTYDAKGNVTSVKDPLGNVYEYTWNERNKLLSETNPMGETTSYDYDAKGNLSAVFHPNGNTVEYFYDKIDRLVKVADNLGVIGKYTYDANGNMLTLTDGLDRTVTYTYDALNRRVSETLPSGAVTKYAYDANSNLLSVTDAKGNATRYTYSSLNQPLTVADALDAVTKYEYDANGNLLRATDAKGQVTAYAYDALNRNTAIAFANGLSLQYSYDELGNVILYKDRAEREYKYAYDAMNNLVSRTYPDGSTDKYTYNMLGEMLTAVNKHATVKFDYDKTGRVISEELNGRTTGYSYDVAAGRRTIVYPGGMKVIEQLNARNLIASIIQNGEEVVTMDYNAAGQRTRLGYANGTATEFAYNGNGWLQGIKDNKGVQNLAMTFDALGNMIERKDLISSERSENYGYDAISQLTSFKRGTAVNNEYEFDLLGNRKSYKKNGIVTNYYVNNVNAYTAVSGALSFSPTYDANGNLLTDAKHNYQYDFNNRLVGVDGTATYKYDALGRRIAKNDTRYYYVGDQMVEEITGDDATSYLYGNDIDEALQMRKGGKVYYYHSNHLGSTMALSDADGKLQERVDYDAYGEPLFYDGNGKQIAESSVGNNILFTGREYDAEAGIYYYRARSMHPGLGRFMQKDPLMYVDGMNDYAYTYNSPIVYKDIYGEERNPVIDFLFGGCLDLPKNWQCAKNGWEKARAAGLCALDVAGFIPGAGTAAKGAKGVGAAAKGAKVLNKADNVIDAAKNTANNVADKSPHDFNPSRWKYPGDTNPSTPKYRLGDITDMIIKDKNTNQSSKTDIEQMIDAVREQRTKRGIPKDGKIQFGI